MTQPTPTDRLLSFAVKILIGFGLLWLLLASFELNFQKDLYKAYTARALTGSDAKDLPKLLPLGVKEYRVSKSAVVGKTGQFIDQYKNCTVFDTNNWSCTFTDDSATFGASEGKYFNRDNLTKYPHLAGYGEEVVLSRLGYILLSCRWDGIGLQSLACIVRPFII